MVLVATGCGDSEPQVQVTVRDVDAVRVMSPEDARELLDGGGGTVGDAQRTGAARDQLEVVESGRSFQTRLGTALTTFNTCLADRGFEFIGLPGQGNPDADDDAYIAALITCNGVSNIGAVLQEQNDRQSDLTAAQKQALNESARDLVECMLDRGWAFGEMVPNQNGILTPSSFPPDIATRGEEWERDLDACGWYDLDLG